MNKIRNYKILFKLRREFAERKAHYIHVNGNLLNFSVLSGVRLKLSLLGCPEKKKGGKRLIKTSEGFICILLMWV